MTGQAWLLAAATVSGALAGLAGAAFMLGRSKRGGTPVDLPDSRRLHTTPTPRGGGLGLPIAGITGAVFALVAISGTLDRRLASIIVFVWAVPNGIMGFVDDYRPMPSRVKFVLQAALALTSVALGLRLEALVVPPLGGIDLGPTSWVVSALWLVWNANVYNFMDGMDALAAVSGAIFAAALGTLALLHGAPALALIGFSFVGASLGFLHYNRPPARIFMGDAGSLFAGATLGGLGLALPRSSIDVPIAASVIAMGTFVWDATYTIGWRTLRGEAMRPHRTHLYQRLALAGWSHRSVRAVYFSAASIMAVGAIALPSASRIGQGLIMLSSIAIVLALTLVTIRAERKRSPADS